MVTCGGILRRVRLMKDNQRSSTVWREPPDNTNKRVDLREDCAIWQMPTLEFDYVS